MELTGIHPPHLCGDITGMSQVREKGLTQGFQHLGTGSLCSQKAAGKKKKKNPSLSPKTPLDHREKEQTSPKSRDSPFPNPRRTLWEAPLCWATRLVLRQHWVAESSATRTCPSRAHMASVESPLLGRNLAWKTREKKQGKGGKKGEGGGGGGRRGIAEEAEEERGGEGDAGELVELFWELSWVLFCVFWELSQLSWE